MTFNQGVAGSNPAGLTTLLTESVENLHKLLRSYPLKVLTESTKVYWNRLKSFYKGIHRVYRIPATPIAFVIVMIEAILSQNKIYISLSEQRGSYD